MFVSKLYLLWVPFDVDTLKYDDYYELRSRGGCQVARNQTFIGE